MAITYINIHNHHFTNPDMEMRSIMNIAVNEKNPATLTSLISAGLHPWFINEGDPYEGILTLENLLEENKIIAVGECGLDKVISVNFEIQEEIFKEQIRLAHDYRKAMIIHCVRAYEEVVACLKAEKFMGNVVFHGFNKKNQLAISLLQKGYYLSFGAAILTGKLDQTIAVVPLSRLFLETDDSDQDIRELYSYVAKLKNISLEELNKNILANYQLVFE